MNARYNAVIVGQTGVGKSSLINYLYGSKSTETGVGKPITKNGFHPIDFEINGLPVRLFDSWGLEVGKEDIWMKELEAELAERSVNESADKWFHSAFYCIQASGARIQDCDIKIINKFIEYDYKISVVLTKADLIDEDEENLLKEELKKQFNGISIIAVCNEGKKTRTGVSEPFGKYEIEQQAFSDFFDSLILRLPLRCKSVMKEEINKWVSDSKRKARKDADFIGWNQKTTEKEFQDSAKKLQQQLGELVNSEVKHTFEMYGNFSSRLGYPPLKSNDSNNQDDIFGRTLSDNVPWWRYTRLILIAPVYLTWAIFSGKDSVIGDMDNYIHACQKELTKTIDEHVNEITKMLESLKKMVTEQKLLN